jgi:twitching motility protein PilT
MEVPSIFLNRILIETAKRSASSLHLSIGSVPMIRVDGQLREIEKEEIITLDLIEKIVNTIVSEDNRKKLEKDRELVFVKEFAENFRFRIDIYYQKDLLSITFNHIQEKIRTWDELGMPEIIRSLIKFNAGLLIVCGPNNSGRTTTSCALIEEINNTEVRNIITLEDPIENVFINKKSIIEQRQVGRDVISFEKGLVHCLNEDVDVVYINEIKQGFADVISLILELAAGNSLVILELNSENSLRVLEKIINLGSAQISKEALKFNLADSLLGIICQRLIPARGGGVALASEILTMSAPIKSLIREGKIYQLESIIQTSREEGMISMKKSTEDLIRAGKIKKEEAQKLKLI